MWQTQSTLLWKWYRKKNRAYNGHTYEKDITFLTVVLQCYTTQNPLNKIKENNETEEKYKNTHLISEHSCY